MFRTPLPALFSPPWKKIIDEYKCGPSRNHDEKVKDWVFHGEMLADDPARSELDVQLSKRLTPQRSAIARLVIMTLEHSVEGVLHQLGASDPDSNKQDEHDRFKG